MPTRNRNTMYVCAILVMCIINTLLLLRIYNTLLQTETRTMIDIIMLFTTVVVVFCTWLIPIMAAKFTNDKPEREDTHHGN